MAIEYSFMSNSYTAYIYTHTHTDMYVYIYVSNIKTHIHFSQTFRLFSKPSTVCVDKALDEKFTYTAEIKN